MGGGGGWGLIRWAWSCHDEAKPVSGFYRGFGFSAVLGSLTSAAKVYFGPWGLVAWPCCETEAPSGNYRGDGGGGRCKDSGVRGF